MAEQWKSPSFSEAVGGLTSIIGAVGQAQGAKYASKYSAQTEAANAAALKAQAEQAATLASLEKEQIEAKNKRMIVAASVAAGVLALIALVYVGKRK